ncbi:uncharacterized protein LOC124373596, partial [Homalodisca vitripennis]|uniref:uncharacterized protein LOC124373596 n=1 Tax=Homalodisca vitripennis TaxID=197043 RepID=UPI001EEC6D9B
AISKQHDDPASVSVFPTPPGSTHGRPPSHIIAMFKSKQSVDRGSYQYRSVGSLNRNKQGRKSRDSVLDRNLLYSSTRSLDRQRYPSTLSRTRIWHTYQELDSTGVELAEETIEIRLERSAGGLGLSIAGGLGSNPLQG